MTSHWRLRPHEPAKIAELSHGAGIHALVAQLLLNRGITTLAAAVTFLAARRDSLHDPETLPGVAEAADRIVRAIKEGRKIVIYGDYDVDGVCGTSLLWACLRLAGAADAAYYIPHRIDEGYGLSAEALRRIVAEMGASLIVTVDCGITAIAEARVARELGVELIVTDHHAIGPELPDAAVVVHPRRPDSTYPFGDLCGCGVAFKLAWQICKSFGDGKKASPHLRDFLLEAINLVALATVADVVPLEGENRVFVRHGLRGMAAEPSVGLRALMDVSGCLGRSRLNSGTLGFQLAPRINAAGRLERARAAVEMLTTGDAAVAAELARGLNDCNSRRQEIERSIVGQAHRMVDDWGGIGQRGAIVVAHPEWHAGVIGIVAGRLAETYHRPAVVVALAEPMSQGSARSVPGFNLIEALRACADGLAAYGGHQAAAGLKLAPGDFPGFAERFDDYCRSQLTTDQMRKELLIDAEVPLGMMSTALVSQVEDLEPYGIGNPRPVLLTEGVTVIAPPRVVGERQNHLQVRFGQGRSVVRAVAWNMAHRAGDLAQGTVCSLAFHPSINEWQGRREVQLEVRDFQIQGEPAHVAT
jgi:single-stranded-DNA-specific exonuclease